MLCVGRLIELTLSVGSKKLGHYTCPEPEGSEMSPYKTKIFINGSWVSITKAVFIGTGRLINRTVADGAHTPPFPPPDGNLREIHETGLGRHAVCHDRALFFRGKRTYGRCRYGRAVHQNDYDFPEAGTARNRRIRLVNEWS